MAIRERLSGNEATAYAIKQINPDVMPAFPITPSTEIPQYVATFIANGEIDTEFIPVESEHSSMSAAIGAEVTEALFHAHSTAQVRNYIYGLDGRDFKVEDATNVFNELEQLIVNGVDIEQHKYIGLRG